LFGAMINAEIGCVFPNTGGQYVYYRYMYGDFFAYLYGWSCFMVSNTAAIAGIAFVFAQYSGYFIHIPELSKEVAHSICLSIPFVGKFYLLENFGLKVIAMGLIITMTLVNILSVKAAGAVQVFFTALKTVALVFIVFAIFLPAKGTAGNLITSSAGFNLDGWGLITAFIAATTGALAAYDGWNNLGFVAGEIKNPQKNLPRGLIFGLGACILLYVLTYESYAYMLPVDEMKHSSLVAADALNRSAGVAGAGIIAVLVMTSTAGSTNGNILPAARVTFAMAREKNFLQWAGKVNKKRVTPANALFIHCIWVCMLVMIGSFDLMMDMFIFISWIYYAFLAYGIFILRKHFPAAERPFKIKGYPYLPLIFIAFSVIYVVITLYNDIHNYMTGKSLIINSVMGLLLTASGIPLYWLFKRQKTADLQNLKFEADAKL
jgi:basic amino acid/polyamine antiporter, APA family